MTWYENHNVIPHIWNLDHSLVVPVKVLKGVYENTFESRPQTSPTMHIE